MAGHRYARLFDQRRTGQLSAVNANSDHQQLAKQRGTQPLQEGAGWFVALMFLKIHTLPSAGIRQPACHAPKNPDSATKHM